MIKLILLQGSMVFGMLLMVACLIILFFGMIGSFVFFIVKGRNKIEGENKFYFYVENILKSLGLSLLFVFLFIVLIYLWIGISGHEID